MHLADSSWTDARDADTDLALLPVGSTEQHGPHAPLGTDFLTAEAVAEEGAAAFDGEVVVGPTVPVGIAEEHRQFPGSLWVSEDTFRAYVRETVASLAYHGFGRVVVVNGHGGNVAALRELCGDLTRSGEAYAVPFTWFDAVAAEDMGHAGPAETSFVQHLAPDLVREDRLAEARDGAAETWGDWVEGVNLAYDSAEFADSGVVGDPTEADASLGEQLLEESAGALARLLDEVAERDIDRPADRR